jgi:CBS domain-containing protein
MENNEPLIQDFMTQQPQTIEGKEGLDAAHKIMSTFGIRHLPVTTDGVVVGMLSQRELDLAMQIEVVDSKQFIVIDACSEKPYIAYPNTPLREVVGVMAREHLGSAIIMENAKPVGIFTTVDACRVLHDLIEVSTQEECKKNIRKLRSSVERR